MSKLTHLADQALALVEHTGTNIKHAVMPTPEQWVKTGMALEAARSNAVNVGRFARRHSVAILAAVAVVSAGITVYAMYHNRRKKMLDSESAERKAQQIQARRAIARKRSPISLPEDDGASLGV